VRSCAAAVDFRHGGGLAHVVEQRVVEAVMGHRVTLNQLAPGEFGMGQRIAAEQKERRPHAFAPERIEDGRGGAGPWAVIEGKDHLLVRQRQGGRKSLRPTRGVDAASTAIIREVPSASGRPGQGSAAAVPAKASAAMDECI
jgi:hypothetical protein